MTKTYRPTLHALVGGLQILLCVDQLYYLIIRYQTHYTDSLNVFKQFPLKEALKSLLCHGPTVWKSVPYVLKESQHEDDLKTSYMKLNLVRLNFNQFSRQTKLLKGNATFL